LGDAGRAPFFSYTLAFALQLRKSTENLSQGSLEDQVSVFMTPGHRMTQLYPQALGTHFSRLLRHAWVTVGLFFNPDHHTGLLFTH
jgi:hypothetical protein